MRSYALAVAELLTSLELSGEGIDRVSMASGFCPGMANRTAQPWPLELPSGGQ